MKILAMKTRIIHLLFLTLLLPQNDLNAQKWHRETLHYPPSVLKVPSSLYKSSPDGCHKKIDFVYMFDKAAGVEMVRIGYTDQYIEAYQYKGEIYLNKTKIFETDPDYFPENEYKKDGFKIKADVYYGKLIDKRKKIGTVESGVIISHLKKGQEHSAPLDDYIILEKFEVIENDPKFHQHTELRNILITECYCKDGYDIEAKIKKRLKQEKIDNEYQALIDGADYDYNYSQYEDALKKYRKASGLKPDETYPKEQIKKIKEEIGEKENKEVEEEQTQNEKKEQEQQEEADEDFWSGESEKAEDKSDEDFWSGEETLKESQKADDFWTGNQSAEDLDFWSGQGTSSEEIELQKEVAKATGNQFIGEETVKTQMITIFYFDHGLVDGDRVNIYHNGKKIASNITLKGYEKSIEVKLKNGINRISFEALNEGSKGDNTASFRITDANGKNLYNNQWSIQTGYKGTLLLIKK